MTTDERKIQVILDAGHRNGNKVIVIYNIRYMLFVQKIWQVLISGEIGRITSVYLSWNLESDHSASGFCRWHVLADDLGGQYNLSF